MCISQSFWQAVTPLKIASPPKLVNDKHELRELILADSITFDCSVYKVLDDENNTVVLFLRFDLFTALYQWPRALSGIQ